MLRASAGGRFPSSANFPGYIGAPPSSKGTGRGSTGRGGCEGSIQRVQGSEGSTQGFLRGIRGSVQGSEGSTQGFSEGSQVIPGFTSSAGHCGVGVETACRPAAGPSKAAARRMIAFIRVCDSFDEGWLVHLVNRSTNLNVLVAHSCLYGRCPG